MGLFFGQNFEPEYINVLLHEINNSFHLARKYAMIFVGGHLFQTDVQGQIYEHIFAPDGGYRVYCP